MNLKPEVELLVEDKIDALLKKFDLQEYVNDTRLIKFMFNVYCQAQLDFINEHVDTFTTFEGALTEVNLLQMMDYANGTLTLFERNPKPNNYKDENH